MAPATDGYGVYSRPCGSIRNRYGIGVADVERTLEARDGVCLICEKRGPEHVDHDHETGKVRGILCFNCNQGLGNFRDDVRSLIRAVGYLMRGSSWKGKGLDGFQVSRHRLAAA